VKTPHDLFFVDFFTTAARATEFAGVGSIHYDHFANVAVGPTDSSEDQGKVESCLPSG
jgi:hypothetical protein